MAKKAEVLFIVFSGPNEVIITTPAQEAQTLKEYFTDGGRKIEDYDRKKVVDGAITVVSRMYVTA